MQHIPGSNNNIADAISRFQDAHFRKLAPEAAATPENIPAWQTQAFTIASCSYAIMVSLNQHVEHTSRDLLPTHLFANINPLPATSLTLQYFCADKSQSISYHTLKVYLAAIRLMHIEHGLPDPTVDQTLLLVCRGIRRHQQITERKRLPITIDILKLLKSYLCVSTYTVCEQRMLWLSFTLSFYGFLRSSECLSLIWSDIKRTDNHLVIELHQSKTDPFRRGQSLQIYPTNSSTCLVRVFTRFVDNIGTTLPHKLVFSAGSFSPLTRSRLTGTIRHLLMQAGMCPTNYASHSFRIGAATTAAAAGLPTWLIKTLGR